MRHWALILGGLTIWAAHFFLLYAIASLWPGQPLANLLAIVATLPALAACGLILWKALRLRRTAADDFQRWMMTLAAFGAALSLLAVTWQGLPALMI